MLHGRLSSCLTNDLSSSTVNSFWLWDLPPPERYLKHRLKLIYTPLSTLTGKKKEKKRRKKIKKTAEQISSTTAICINVSKLTLAQIGNLSHKTGCSRK